jgi:hypothetical protein
MLDFIPPYVYNKYHYLNPGRYVIVNDYILREGYKGSIIVQQMDKDEVIWNKTDLTWVQTLPRITLGDIEVDEQLINSIIKYTKFKNYTKFKRLIKQYPPTEVGIDVQSFPILYYEIRKMAFMKKVRQMKKIKRELLETSAKICMNPKRILRLLEDNVISLDNIETLYDL